MAVTEVLICNIALAKLGAERVQNIETPTSKNEVLCSLYYEPTVDEVLRAHPWNCAIHRQKLSQVSSGDSNYLLTNSDDFGYQYQLPTDPPCIRALDLPNAPKAKYVIEGDYLLTSENEVVLRYIKRVTDPTKVDSLLVKAIAYRLAAELAIDIENSTTDHNEMMKLYEAQLFRAEGINDLEGENMQAENTSWKDAGRSA
jgi:hypothetical protein